jgi:membrane protease YdiL (CAAX protease family)
MLNSLCALIPAVMTFLVLIVRMILEDKMLQAELPGYVEYAERVRYRLLPGVWQFRRGRLLRNTAMLEIGKKQPQTQANQLSFAWMVVLHLLPSALAMLMMLFAGPLLKSIGVLPSVPIIFVFVAPVLVLMQLGFLYYKGKQLNSKFSLQGIVLYRDEPISWWKLAALALPLLAWIAFVWLVIKPPINEYFIEHFFTWMPAYFFDDYFLNNLNQYPPIMLKITGVFFVLSITLGGAVEELYFRGYLLPRMAPLGNWAPIINIVFFSMYHLWSPWENVVRVLGLLPWIFAVWRTRNIYLSLLIHIIINAFSGISMLSLLLSLT